MLKAIELYERRRGPYTKKPGEDLNSILTGITQQKGRVHLAFCEPLTAAHLRDLPNTTANEFHKQVASLLDKRICSAYRLTPNNFIAHDLRSGKDTYREMYGKEEKAENLQKSFATGDWHNYAIYVHALKSSSKMIGALALSEQAAALEAAADAGDGETIRRDHKAVMERYEALSRAITSVVSVPADEDGVLEFSPQEDDILEFYPEDD